MSDKHKQELIEGYACSFFEMAVDSAYANNYDLTDFVNQVIKVMSELNNSDDKKRGQLTFNF